MQYRLTDYYKHFANIFWLNIDNEVLGKHNQ